MDSSKGKRAWAVRQTNHRISHKSEYRSVREKSSKLKRVYQGQRHHIVVRNNTDVICQMPGNAGTMLGIDDARPAVGKNRHKNNDIVVDQVIYQASLSSLSPHRAHNFC
ncbi:hypothetical protein SNK03_007749 [Fusarium graminearum]